MKTLKLFIPFLSALFFLSSCATVKVVTDTDADADFSNYKTFKVVHFVNEEDHKSEKHTVNPMNARRIENAITSQAELRGMTSVESDPDVVLLWVTNVDIEKSYSSHSTYSGGAYWGYRGRYYYGGGPTYTTTDVNKYYIGKLTIAIVDRESEDMIWYGQGQKDISGDAGKAEETINLFVGKIMEQFPIGTIPE